MRDVIIFAGPTLSANEITSLLDAEIRPPVTRGDVLDAALDKPTAIGIIDGYFARVPSVWHKEILWAMSQGIHVFGAASMGALRAAELEPFGMSGFGAVFEQFKSGALTDDDEVAVVHAPEEYGYRALSEAMVNARMTLSAAERDGVISPAGRSRFEEILKALPYPERNYSVLFALSQKEGPLANEATALNEWLPKGRVDQKRDDALLMLRLMADMRRAGWKQLEVRYHFAQTDAWEALRKDVVNRRRLREERVQLGITEQQLLDELIVTRGLSRAYDGALTRAVCLELAQRLGVEVNARAVEALLEEFRREKSLLLPEQFDAWLTNEELPESEIVQFFQKEARIRRVRSGFDGESRAQLLDYLRVTNELGRLRARAQIKQQHLTAVGTSAVPPKNGLSEAAVWRWYFVEYLGEEVPGDIESYARNQRTNVDELRGAVMREYLFVHRGQTALSMETSIPKTAIVGNLQP